MELTDQALHEKLVGMVKDERLLLTQILYHLQEVERRKFYRERGFASLFDYLHRGLGYSEAASFRRISAMRLVTEVPEVLDKIESGALSLSVIAQAQKFFKDEEVQEKGKKLQVLESLAGQSSRVTESILLAQSTTPIGQFTQQPEKVTRLSTEVVKLELTVSAELFEQIQELQRRISHRKATLSETIAHALGVALKKPSHRTSDVGSKNPRYVSPGLRTEILKRGQCEYVDSKSGRRCESRHYLQIDHIEPIALGGDSRPENLRVLCATHNQFLGEGLKLII